MPSMLNTLILITTYRCDLHCLHCLQGFPREQSDFPVELLDRLLTEALPFGARFVNLTGGEAHLHPQFEYIVETIVKYGYTWSLISHGQRTEPYLYLMEKHRKQFKSIGLSMDGATPEKHDEMRQRKGAFERVTTSAKACVEKGFEVWIKTSLNQKNKMQLEELIALAADLGAKGITFGGTIPTAWNQDLLLSDDEALELHEKIVSLRADSPVKLRTTSALHTRGGVNFCQILSLNELAVSPRGDVDFCCDVHQLKGAIGSLRDQSFSALVQTWLERSAGLQVRRVQQIAAGEMGEGFDTCEFCNAYFSSKKTI
jgi:MoaA/NifB/PqqE/SkfB family radical SAM enzyme